MTFAPISGAHFNPAVTAFEAWQGGLRRRELPPYVAAQFVGAVAGVAISHAMFSEPVFAFSEHARQGWGQFLSEFVATFGLVGVIASVRRQPTAVPFAVASYIMSAYWFTASTSFENPAVTVARSLTNTFAGIRAADVPAFLAAQVLGTAAATVLMGWLIPAARTAVPHVVASGAKPSVERKEASR